ncbi:MAG TPA: STAS domain-containing protein [Candidatus Binataceae bacterium]
MEISEQHDGGVVILGPVGRLNNETSPEFQSRLLGCVGSSGASVLVDLSAVDYVSSAGLRALMTASKQSKAMGGRLAVAGLNAVVKEIFAISRFSYVVTVFETPAQALVALR